MTPAHMLIALGMLLSGSINTLSTGWADKQSAVGNSQVATMWAHILGEGDANAKCERDDKGKVTDPCCDDSGHRIENCHVFDHPYFQALGMFVGEFLCLIVYGITRRKVQAQAAQDPNIVVPGGRTKGAFWFAIPAFLDILGTGTMYAGLCLTSASIYQMLRGSVIIFTCLLSMVWLKRTIHIYQWVSVFIVIIGICIVGYVSLAHPKPGSSSSSTGSGAVIVGDILIIIAQMATAVQMCLEEKLMNKFPIAPLKVAGLEGLFGIFILGTILVPMYYITPGGYPIENTPDAVIQISNNWRIPFAMVGNALSIAFFNFFGITVTQQLSASHRMVLDSVRTLLVWAVSLGLGWETFYPLQLLGFFFLTLGTCCYNKIFKIPGFTYPEEPAGESESPAGVSLAQDEYGRGRTESELAHSLSHSLIKEEGVGIPKSNSFVHT